MKARGLIRTGVLLALFWAWGSVALAAEDLVLRGDATCTACHHEGTEPTHSVLGLEPSVLAIGKTRHGTTADGRTPTCADCHGASENHVNHRGAGERPFTDRVFGKGVGQSSAAELNEGCIDCHQGGKRIHWQSSVHASADVACSSCHEVHTQTDRVLDKATEAAVCMDCHEQQRTQFNRPSHHPVVQGLMSCSSCHDAHGDNPSKLVRGSVNETCYTCHAEKRGPFVHNHQPVAEDCSICHAPHGTTVPSLLKARPQFLCQECHAGSGHRSVAASLPPGRTTSTSALATVGRSCMNCHTNIHGGNSTVNSPTAGRFRR